MVFWYPSIGGGSNVSICVTKTPSRYTLAIPMLSLRQPIQLTEVPVKANVAREPGALDSEIDPSLQLQFRLPSTQLPLWTPSVSCSSTLDTGSATSYVASNTAD